MRFNTAAPIFACLALVAGGCASAPPSRGGWQKIGGPLRNVSGMALVSDDSQEARSDTHFLVVHDNKNPGEPRFGFVSVGGPTPMPPVAYQPLQWQGGATEPADLEAVCAVPRTPGSFLAMTSAGRLLHLRLSDGGVRVLHESVLPGLKKTPNLEGFAVQSVGGRTVAVWADRGNGEEPAVLYWGGYDAVADVVTLAGKADVKAPFPVGPNTRHVSDLRVDKSGVVWATSASDPGDAGPFESAFFELGILTVDNGTVTFEAASNPTPRWTARRKVEAFELLPGDEGLVYFGADDEIAGGWVYVGRRQP